MQRTKFDRIRIYSSLRSAHLERAKTMVPASIIYERQNYDFDPILTDGLDVVQASGIRLAALLFCSPTKIIEVNEPLMLSGSVRAAIATLIVRAKAGPRVQRRASVVTYAIENRNPLADEPPRRLRSRALWHLRVAAARFVAGRVNKIAYGTDAARLNYESVLDRSLGGSESRTIPAVPSPCSCPPGIRDPWKVLFLGALSDRKGFGLLLRAWPSVRKLVPSAKLIIVGKGPLEEAARRFADEHDGVEILLDPPRTTIHRVLRESRVVVLPSQPAPHWREQVGLPIVEGLAHGCLVATSEETGLASWLSSRGHAVLSGVGTATALTEAIADLLERGKADADVLADLPVVDGRIAADDWLLEPASASHKRS